MAESNLVVANENFLLRVDDNRARLFVDSNDLSLVTETFKPTLVLDSTKAEILSMGFQGPSGIEGDPGPPGPEGPPGPPGSLEDGIIDGGNF